MERVIITGADGFVGSNTVEYFLNQGVEVLAIDLHETPQRLKPGGRLSYLCADAGRLNEYIPHIKQDYYDTLIHFAWIGIFGPERADYEIQVQNAMMTVNCIKSAKKLGCGRFVGIGSIMEKEIAYAIAEPGCKPGMGYVYGVGKMMAHNIGKMLAAQIGIEFVWPMLTNAYGVGEISPRFVNTTIRRILNKEPLEFTPAIQNYDFLYVTEVAKAFYLAALKGKPFCEYMIGSSKPRPLREFIMDIIHTVDETQKPLFGAVPFTGVNIPLTCFDMTNFKNDTGFESEIPFTEGIKMTRDWLVQQC